MPTDAAPQAEPAAPPEAEYFCPRCDYSLRGIDCDRCPECGESIDRATLARSRLPWVHRRQIGRIRAYWRTVWTVTFRPLQLAQEMSRPVSLANARWFWFINAMLLALPAGLIWGIFLEVTDPEFRELIYMTAGEAMLTAPAAPGAGGAPPIIPPSLFLPLGVALIQPWIAGGCLLLFLLMATAMPSYLAHPPRLPVVRQNRAIALSFYAGAPLAWLPVIAGPVAGLVWLSARLEDAPDEFIFDVAIFATCSLLVGVPLLLWWFRTAGLLGRTTGRSTAGVFFVLPLFWLLSAMVCLVLIPWSLGLILVIIDSLR